MRDSVVIAREHVASSFKRPRTGEIRPDADISKRGLSGRKAVPSSDAVVRSGRRRNISRRNNGLPSGEALNNTISRVSVDTDVSRPSITQPVNRMAEPQAIPSIGVGSHSRLLVAAGRVGPVVIALGSLFGVVRYMGDGNAWLYEAVAAVLLVRALCAVSRGSSSAVGRRAVRHNLRQALTEEGVFSVLLLAACFVMDWPVEPAVVGSVIVVNLLFQLLLQAVLQAALSRIPRSRKVYAHSKRVQRVIIFGTGSQAQKVADTFLDTPQLETVPIGFLDYRRIGFWRYRDIPLLGRPELLNTLGMTEQIDGIFMALEPDDMFRSDELFRTSESMGITVCVLPDLYRKSIARTRMAHVNGFPVVTYHTMPVEALPLLLKNIMDKLLALAALAISAPVLLVTAAVIKIDSRGPVLFKQVRMGLNGRRFHLYKLRTMCADAERKKASLLDRNEMSGPVFKMKEDPRITRVGKFLRKYSLDEFPQLLNVLQGDMSLVGPRPPLPHEVARFEPWQRRKLSVKPGVTCLWQVNGRNAIDFEHWMKLDLEYIDNWSLALDAKILAKTIPAVLRGSGS
jgi:exopolysaccharide biosynthesis polyprenyl glycosylphosphotransferase